MNTKTNPFQLQSVPKGQLNQVLKTENRCFAQHVVRTSKTTKPLLLKYPFNRDPAQHKTLQSYRGVWLPPCTGQETAYILD